MSNEVKSKLKDEELKKFKALKKYHGLGQNSAMIRFLITKEYRILTEDAQLNKKVVKPRELKEASQNA